MAFICKMLKTMNILLHYQKMKKDFVYEEDFCSQFFCLSEGAWHCIIQKNPNEAANFLHSLGNLKEFSFDFLCI